MPTLSFSGRQAEDWRCLSQNCWQSKLISNDNFRILVAANMAFQFAAACAV